MGIIKCDEQSHLTARQPERDLDLTNLVQFSTTQLIRIITQQFSQSNPNDNSFEQTPIPTPNNDIIITVDAVSSLARYQHIVRYVQQFCSKVGRVAAKILHSLSTYLDAASVNNVISQTLKSYGLSSDLNIPMKTFKLVFTIGSVQIDCMCFGLFGDTNQPSLYVYDFFGCGQMDKNGNSEFNSTNMIEFYNQTSFSSEKAPYITTLSLTAVLCCNSLDSTNITDIGKRYYMDNGFGIIPCVRNIISGRIDYFTAIDYIVYLSSYKTLLDFSKVIYHYDYCITTGNTHNMFIGIDNIACNISSIFIPCTINGRNDNPRNVFLFFYMRMHVYNSLTQPKCLYTCPLTQELCSFLFMKPGNSEPYIQTLGIQLTPNGEFVEPIIAAYAAKQDIIEVEQERSSNSSDQPESTTATPNSTGDPFDLLDDASSSFYTFGFGKKRIQKRFIQSALTKMRKRDTLGSFKKWCIRNKLISTRGKITRKCINLAKKSKSLKIRRRAIFAQNIGAFEKKKKTRFGKNNKRKPVRRNTKRSTKRKPVKRVVNRKTSTKRKPAKKNSSRSIIRNSPDRKSPAVSATSFPVGTVKTGNDGNQWIIKKTTAGVQRWVKT